MKPRTAGYLLLLLNAALILFHLLLLSGILPYQNIWGGRLQNDTQLYLLEGTSLLISLFLMLVLLMKTGNMRRWFSEKTGNRVLWIYFFYFILNTIGNLLSKSRGEQAFAALTLIFAVLLWRILKPEKAKPVAVTKRMQR